MKIVLATPLYPPDIAEPAPYIKELASRLSHEHDVHIVTYGKYVEPVGGVRVTAIDKQAPILVRLVRFFFALRRAIRGAQVIYAENGPSVELPILLLSFISSRRYVLHLGDMRAHRRSIARPYLNFLSRVARSRAELVVKEIPLERPELIPFLPQPVQELKRYEDSWTEHLQSLNSIFQHA